MNKGLVCIALHGHAVEVFGPIIILRDDARRITFMCPRCETVRQDVWTTKGQLLTRSYRHGVEYAEWLKAHERPTRTTTARAEMLTLYKTVEAPREKGRNVNQTSPVLRQARRGPTGNRNLPVHKRKRNNAPKS